MSSKIWNYLFTSHSGIQNLSIDHSNKEFVYRVYNPQLRNPVIDSNGNQQYDIVTSKYVPESSNIITKSKETKCIKPSKFKTFDLTVDGNETEDKTRININKAINNFSNSTIENTNQQQNIKNIKNTYLDLYFTGIFNKFKSDDMNIEIKSKQKISLYDNLVIKNSNGDVFRCIEEATFSPDFFSYQY